MRALALLVLLAGCAPDLKGLAEDKNAICLHMTSVWFSVDLNRNGGCSQTAMGPPLSCPSAAKP